MMRHHFTKKSCPYHWPYHRDTGSYSWLD